MVMQFFIIILWLLFGIVNYRIITTDIKSKVIPNNYILILGVIGLILISLQTGLLVQVMLGFALCFIVSFILYTSGFWSAGDAKYLLILSLFIGENSIITFVGNIGMITIIYMLFFIGYVWGIGFALNVRQSRKRKGIFKEKIMSLGKMFQNFITRPKVDQVLHISQVVNIFIVLFISIRLLREDVVGYVMQTSLVENHAYFLYMLIAISVGIIGVVLGISKIWSYYANKVAVKLHIKKDIVDISGASLLTLVLLSALLIQYFQDPVSIIHSIYKIFTFYIVLYFIVRIFIFFYKITFIDGEAISIDIKYLKVGDVLKIDHLQKVIERRNPENVDAEIEIVNTIKNTVNQEQIDALKKIFISMKKRTIRVIDTFAFSYYIFGGCIITLLFGDRFLQYFISVFASIISTF